MNPDLQRIDSELLRIETKIDHLTEKLEERHVSLLHRVSVLQGVVYILIPVIAIIGGMVGHFI